MNKEAPLLSVQVSQNQSGAESNATELRRTSVTRFLILKVVKALQSCFTFYSHRTSQAKPWLDYSAFITKCTQTKGAIVPGTHVHTSLHCNTAEPKAVWSCCRTTVPLRQDLGNLNKHHSNAGTASCAQDTRLCISSCALRSFRVDHTRENQEKGGKTGTLG